MIKSFVLHFKKLDLPLIICPFLLTGLGLISIYSSSLGRGDFLNFGKQIIFFVIGFFSMIILSFLDWRALRENPYFILVLYFISVGLLIGLFFFASITRGVK